MYVVILFMYRKIVCYTHNPNPISMYVCTSLYQCYQIPQNICFFLFQFLTKLLKAYFNLQLQKLRQAWLHSRQHLFYPPTACGSDLKGLTNSISRLPTVAAAFERAEWIS